MYRRMISVVALVLCMVMLVGCSSVPKDGSFGKAPADLMVELSSVAEEKGYATLDVDSLYKLENENLDLGNCYHCDVAVDHYSLFGLFFDCNDEGNVQKIHFSVTSADTQKDGELFYAYAEVLASHFTGDKNAFDTLAKELEMDYFRTADHVENTVTIDDITFIYQNVGGHVWWFKVLSPAAVAAEAADS